MHHSNGAFCYQRWPLSERELIDEVRATTRMRTQQLDKQPAISRVANHRPFDRHMMSLVHRSACWLLTIATVAPQAMNCFSHFILMFWVFTAIFLVAMRLLPLLPQNYCSHDNANQCARHEQLLPPPHTCAELVVANGVQWRWAVAALGRQ